MGMETTMVDDSLDIDVPKPINVKKRVHKDIDQGLKKDIRKVLRKKVDTEMRRKLKSLSDIESSINKSNSGVHEMGNQILGDPSSL